MRTLNARLIIVIMILALIIVVILVILYYQGYFEGITISEGFENETLKMEGYSYEFLKNSKEFQ